MNTTKVFFITALTLQAVVGLTAKVTNREQCFDNLEKEAAREVKNTYFASVRNVIINPISSGIFDCFIKASSNGDESLYEKYFKIYKKLENFKDKDSFGQSQLKELISTDLPYRYEKYLTDKVNVGDKNVQQEALSYVQDQLTKEIELSQNYKDFKVMFITKYKPESHSSNLMQADYTEITNAADKNYLPALVEVFAFLTLCILQC